MPDEIATIKAFQDAYPHIKQVACFDTNFHRNMPDYVKDYPLPAKYKKKGLVKYGFHGLSYEFILQELANQKIVISKERLIIAHLGNGSSMAAVKTLR